MPVKKVKSHFAKTNEQTMRAGLLISEGHQFIDTKKAIDEIIASYKITPQKAVDTYRSIQKQVTAHNQPQSDGNSRKKVVRIALGTKKAMDPVFTSLIDRFVESKEENEQKQMIEIAKLFKEDITPNNHLIHVCKLGAVVLLEFLLKEFRKINVNYEDPANVGMRGIDALILSDVPLKEKMAILTLLFQQKANLAGIKLSDPASTHFIPLQIAAQRFEFPVIKTLIENGADILYSKNCEKNAVITTITTDRPVLGKESFKDKKELEEFEKGRTEIVHYLATTLKDQLQKLKSEKPQNQEKIKLIQETLNYALLVASQKGNVQLIDSLLNVGADPLYQIKGSSLIPANCLTLSVKHNQFKACHFLLSKLPKDKATEGAINIIKGYALTVAISTYQVGMVQLLLNAKTDINLSDKFYYPALHESIFSLNRLKSTSPLLFKDDSKINPLKLTLEQASIMAEKILGMLLKPEYAADLRKNPVSIDPDDKGVCVGTPLLLASRYNVKQAYQLLLPLYVSTANEKEIKEDSELFLHKLMTENVSVEILKAFKDKFTQESFYTQYKNKFSPLSIAIINGNTPVVKYCFETYALDPNKAIRVIEHTIREKLCNIPVTPLMEAVACENVELVKFFAMDLQADMDCVFTTQDYFERKLLFPFNTFTKDIYVWLLAENLLRLTDIKVNSKGEKEVFINSITPFFALLAGMSQPSILKDGSICISSKTLAKHNIFKSSNIAEASIMVLPGTILTLLQKYLEALQDESDLTEEEVLALIMNEVNDDISMFQEFFANFASAKGFVDASENLFNHFLEVDIVLNKIVNTFTADLQDLKETMADLQALGSGTQFDGAKISSKTSKLKGFERENEFCRRNIVQEREVFLKWYKEKSALFTKLAMIKHSKALDINEARDANESLRAMTSSLGRMKVVMHDIYNIIDQLKQFHTDDILPLYVKYGKHKRNVEEQKALDEKRAAEKKAEIEKRAAMDEKHHQELLAVNERIKRERLATREAWFKQREEAKAKRESATAIADLKRSDDNTKALLLSFTDKLRGAPQALAKPRPLTMNEHLPLGLQEKIGGELEQLASVLEMLKPITEASGTGASGKDETETTVLDIIIKRRTLLGLMARCMEYFVQQGLSPKLDVNLARHFRNTVFHGKCFPEVTQSSLSEAIRVNDDIQAMAEKVLSFLLNQTAMQVKEWEQVRKAIASPLFDKIFNEKASEKQVDKKMYLENLHKELAILKQLGDSTILAKSSQGNSPLVLKHAKGFTHAMLGTYAARTRALWKTKDEPTRKEYQRFIQLGKEYRHLENVKGKGK